MLDVRVLYWWQNDFTSAHDCWILKVFFRDCRFSEQVHGSQSQRVALRWWRSRVLRAKSWCQSAASASTR